MANTHCSAKSDSKSKGESADESDEESDNLEESPCGRWVKRREEVQQRDIPGIDVAYLAMDTEEGSVAPEAIHHHVRTCCEDLKNMCFIAPECGSSLITPAIDIFAFGMCALEMAALEICGHGESTSHITNEAVNRTIESLEDPLQKDFIQKCLKKVPTERPTAKELLFHPVIFEVHSLKLLSAHLIVNSALYQPEQLTDEALRTKCNHSDVLAYVPYKGGQPGPSITKTKAKKLEVEKFLDDVRNGIYPLTAYAATYCPVVRHSTATPETADNRKVGSPEAYEQETRRIINIMCNIKPQENNPNLMMTVLLRMDDKMNRQLSCEVSQFDTPFQLAEELVFNGFINEADRDMVATLISDTISRRHIPDLPVTTSGDKSKSNAF